MTHIEIDAQKCIGCGMCVSSCPFGAIIIEEKKAKISNSCTLCGSCISSCKFEAIHIEKDVIVTEDLSSYKGIWVFAEQKKGSIANVTFELLGIGRKLADDLNTNLSAVLIGAKIKIHSEKLIEYGADKVYWIEDPSLKYYNDEIYCTIMTELIQKKKPEIVLIGATAYGRSLAPKIASRLNTGLTADCTDLEIDPNKKILIQTRPAFGGNLMASIICPNHRPQMATVRPKVMKAIKPDYNRKGKIIEIDVNIPRQAKSKILDFINSFKGGLNLAEADIIVSCGRGLGEAKNLELLKELADLLGASVGASRAVVDSGWIDYCHQIGQTGKTVAPKIYFAFGISGAVQHLAGMSTSDIIIAVNKDKDAPIFKIANYGIIADAIEVISALIEYIKKRKSK